MGYSLAITAYRQTCNRSHRAKDNEHRARTIRLTPLGEQVMEEYLAAARSMGKFLCSCGADEGDVKGDAVRCVCALTGSTRQALVKAHTAQNG